MNSLEVIPTCVPLAREDFENDAHTIAAFSPRMHLDIDDGIFAHAVTWPYIKFGHIGEFDFAGIEGVQIDVHLMVEEPHTVAESFIKAGAKRICVHFEAFADKKEMLEHISRWRTLHVEVGLAFLLDTPLDELTQVAHACDFVHLMTIPSIGRQGILYDERGEGRVSVVHRNFPDLMISVDGGVNDKNIVQLVRAGARRFGVGAAIMKAPDPLSAYHLIKATAESAL